MEAIVLAGGLGTRLRSVVSDRPKPLAPVAGIPFLHFVLDYWKTQGVTRFILAVSHLSDHFRTTFDRPYKGTEVDFSVELTPRGTGGAVAQALDFTKKNGPVLLLNGDTFFPAPLKALLQFHERHATAMTLALAEVPQDSRYGRVALEGDRVAGWAVDASRSHWINGGVYILGSGIARKLQSYATASHTLSLENEVFPRLLAECASIYGYKCRAPFLDIGIPEDYARAPEFFRDLPSSKEMP